MPSVLVIADDLTGATATGAMFSRLGLRTRTVSSRSTTDADLLDPGLDVLVAVTGSRQLEPEQARARVAEALTTWHGLVDPVVLLKRVDTTLRGPMAAELAEVLSCRRASHDGRVVALAVPAYPAAGRTTVGGIHLLDGQPLARTAAAHDPVTPVTTSRASVLLTSGTSLTATELHLDDLGADDADERLARAAHDHDVVVVDAVTDGDVARTARAAARVRKRMPDTDFVVVDSGPFGAAYCHALGLPDPRSRPDCLLVVVGSPSAHSRDQLTAVTECLPADIRELEPTVDAATAADMAIASVREGRSTVGWRTSPVSPDTAARFVEQVPRTLASATARVVESCPVGGLFVCGGEAATAILESLGATGLDIESEVQPLVVAGRLAGGPWHGLPVVTKGGLVGDDRAILDSLFALQTMMTQRTRTNSPVGKAGSP